MRRRDFIKGIAGSAAGWPLAARAQQPEPMRRIGVLMAVAEDDAVAQERLGPFRQTLRKLGWIDSRNVRVDVRWAFGDINRAKTYAAEIVGLAPEVIVAHSGPVLSALRRQTSTIPIIFLQVTDPVGQGFVQSLARPGGNITGFTHFEPSMGGKWLEMLKEIAPHTERVALLFNPESASRGAGSGIYLHLFEAQASAFALRPTLMAVRDADEIERGLEAFAHELDGGVIVPPDIFNTVHRDVIIAVAAKQRLPAIYPYRYYAAAGGLLSYGVDLVDQYRSAASYVDRILKGEKAGELPVQAPTKFELIINLKTANALGLTVPQTLLVAADEVIE